MKKILIAALLLAPLPALAQQQEVTLTVNREELKTIGEGLSELPYKNVVQLMNKLQGQVIQQQQPVKAEPSKPVDNDKPK